MAKKPKSSSEARAVRLAPILEANRKKLAPELSKGFVEEIAGIEERFQFNDGREDAKRRIRGALEIEVQERLLAEADNAD